MKKILSAIVLAAVSVAVRRYLARASAQPQTPPAIETWENEGGAWRPITSRCRRRRCRVKQPPHPASPKDAALPRRPSPLLKMTGAERGWHSAWDAQRPILSRPAALDVGRTPTRNVGASPSGEVPRVAVYSPDTDGRPKAQLEIRPSHPDRPPPLVLGIAASLAIAVYAELGYRRLELANRQMAVALEMQATVHETLALIVDAETGQRAISSRGARNI